MKPLERSLVILAAFVLASGAVIVASVLGLEEAPMNAVAGGAGMLIGVFIKTPFE